MEGRRAAPHVAPCTETQATATCASKTEPCFYDPTCKLGGLGKLGRQGNLIPYSAR